MNNKHNDENEKYIDEEYDKYSSEHPNEEYDEYSCDDEEIPVKYVDPEFVSKNSADIELSDNDGCDINSRECLDNDYEDNNFPNYEEHKQSIKYGGEHHNNRLKSREDRQQARYLYKKKRRARFLIILFSVAFLFALLVIAVLFLLRSDNEYPEGYPDDVSAEVYLTYETIVEDLDNEEVYSPYETVEDKPIEDEPEEVSVSTSIDKLNTRIQVLNGAGVVGLAGSFSDKLAAEGYNIVNIDNYRGSSRPETRIIVRTQGWADELKQFFNSAVEQVDESLSDDYDIIIIIGTSDR